MFKPIIAAILLLCLSMSANAQQTRTVYLIDAITDAPVQGAFFSYDSLQFGVSDKDGKFLLELEASASELSISHLSYADTSLLVSFDNSPLKLPLGRGSFALPEISVSSSKGRKFRSPAKLLAMALKAVPDNYRSEVSNSTGFYKETITHKSCPVAISEGLLEYRLSPYTQKHKHKKVWSETWKRRYASYPHPFRGKRDHRLSVEHAEGTQHYPGLDDAYRPLRIRYSNYLPPLEGHPVFSDGPLDMIALDKVRLGYGFLSRKDLKKYTYKLVDSVFINNTYCYHLTFKPVDNEPTRYMGINKVPKTGAFSGDIYISIENLAIVRYEAYNTKLIIRNNGGCRPIGARVLPNSLKICVDYRADNTGKWQLYTVKSIARSPVLPDFTAIRTLQLTDVKTGVPAAGQKRWYKSNFLNHLHNLSYTYDNAFWPAFEQSSFYKTASQLNGVDCSAQALKLDFLSEKPEVKVPYATVNGNLHYSKPGDKPKDWEWLETVEDSATTAYLRWENDYYSQYFYKQRPRLDAVAEQFGFDIQGISTETQAPTYPDTVFRKIDEQLGFYRVAKEEEKQLILPVESPPNGYVITDADWNKSANFYYTIADNRDYNRLFTIYQNGQPIAKLEQIDDHSWVKDTLYITTFNKELRVDGFSKWTAKDGLVSLMKEKRHDYEYRLQTLPNGKLVVINESLTDAAIIQEKSGDWVVSKATMPALVAGTGMDGKGCDISIDADYILDCRTIGNQSCAIAVINARHHAFIQLNSESSWTEVTLPEGITLARFSDTNAESITLELEGIGNYGQEAIVNFETQKLELKATESDVIDLEGYADSIIFVTAEDGIIIPCQLRWKRSKKDSLVTTLMKVYAAYGNPYFIGHEEADIAMMNLGFAIVYVHARGGGMLGPDWYEAGRAERKIRACKDYVIALRYFQRQHPLMPTPLVGAAQSAGGPVLGYAVNMHPKLLKAAVFDHAFLDVSGIMKQSDLPLTKYEYQEWGNPSNAKVRKAQLAYSPYANIQKRTYPSLLFLGGLYDQSTPYWQIAKFVARLRQRGFHAPNSIMRINMKGSHPGTPFGPAISQQWEQIAFLWAESVKK